MNRTRNRLRAAGCGWLAAAACWLYPGTEPLLAQEVDTPAPSPSCVVELRENRLTLTARQCPLETVMRELCERLGCALYFDPEIETPVTLSLADQALEKSLSKLLAGVDYLILWVTETDIQGQRTDRITAIRVYGKGRENAAVLVQTGTAAPLSSASALLKDYLKQTDESAVPAARYLLSRMDNPGLLETLRQSYAGSTAADREKIRELVAALSSPVFEKGLIEMAGPAEHPPQDELAWPALQGLANMGTATATDQLLERIEKSIGAAGTGDLAELVRNVTASPLSVAALRAAAGGNKRFSADATRVAAIRALARFRDGQTLALLKRLETDPSAAVRAAVRDLDTGE